MESKYALKRRAKEEGGNDYYWSRENQIEIVELASRILQY